MVILSLLNKCVNSKNDMFHFFRKKILPVLPLSGTGTAVLYPHGRYFPDVSAAERSPLTVSVS
jgi:hypothetical protein